MPNFKGSPHNKDPEDLVKTLQEIESIPKLIEKGLHKAKDETLVKSKKEMSADCLQIAVTIIEKLKKRGFKSDSSHSLSIVAKILIDTAKLIQEIPEPQRETKISQMTDEELKAYILDNSTEIQTLGDDKEIKLT